MLPNDTTKIVKLTTLHGEKSRAPQKYKKNISGGATKKGKKEEEGVVLKTLVL